MTQLALPLRLADHAVFASFHAAGNEELVDWLLPGEPLDRFGIRPRSIAGLIGIPLAPLLHSGWEHLASNTVPLIVLGGLILIRSAERFLMATLVVVLLCGLGVWLIAPTETVHLGASGVVFGYFGYLLARGWFDRSVSSILIGVAVAIIYGGMIWGVLPTRPDVSWESHLCGFVAGVVAARLLTGKPGT